MADLNYCIVVKCQPEFIGRILWGIFQLGVFNPQIVIVPSTRESNPT